MKYVNQKTSALLLTSALALILATNPVAQAIDVPLLDDALVIQGPTTPTPFQTYNYGANSVIQVVNSATIARWSFLMFDLQFTVPNNPNSPNKDNTTDVDVAKAWLYLWVNTVTAPGQFEVRRVTSWPATMAEGKANGAVSANTITWNNKPATGTAIAVWPSTTVVPATVATGGGLEFIAIDVTAAVKEAVGAQGGTPGEALGLALVPVAGSNAQNINVSFDSKESAVAIPAGGAATVRAGHRPRLEVILSKKRVAARGDVSMGTYINGTLP